MSNKHRHILCVDDDPALLELMQLFLERDLPATTVEVCGTTAGAEQLLNTRCYDLIICDINLPGELGTTVVEKILERDPEQPVLLMTEYVGADIIAEVIRLTGAPPHPKFSQRAPAEFLSAVEQFLVKRPCSEAARAVHSTSVATDPRSPESLAAVPGHIGSAIKELRFTSPHVLAARMAC